MSVQAASRFFAFLSLLCWAATVASVVVWVVGRRRSDGAARDLLEALGGLALWLAWVVAAVTTAGSLYYSEVAHYQPCELCWYQRICMYPLAAVLLIAAIGRDRRIWRYVVVPAGVGVVIATYHTQLQAYPDQGSFCPAFNPCTARYVWEMGFVSLPFMALAAFVFVLVMVLLARATDPDRHRDLTDAPEGALEREEVLS